MTLFADIDAKIRQRRETNTDFENDFKAWYARNSSVGLKRKRELESHPLSKIKIPDDLGEFMEENTSEMLVAV